MRKALLLISAVAMLSMTGCSFMTGYEVARALREDERAEEEVMAVEGYDIQVTLSEEWSRQEDTPFDLQCVYDDDEAYASFFYYYYIDVADGTTAEDIFDIQNQDIIDKRDNVKIVEDVSERTSGGVRPFDLSFSLRKETAVKIIIMPISWNLARKRINLHGYCLRTHHQIWKRTGQSMTRFLIPWNIQEKGIHYKNPEIQTTTRFLLEQLVYM